MGILGCSLVGMVICGGRLEVEERKESRCLKEISTRRKSFRENPLSPRLKVIWTALNIYIVLCNSKKNPKFDGFELRYGFFTR
jgi:hypothetical protein